MNAMLGGSLLAATMLVGQTSEPPPLPPLGGGRVIVTDPAPGPRIIQQSPGQIAPAPTSQRPILNWFNREDRPIINKIQSWFKRDPQSNTPEPPYLQPTSNSKVRDTAPPILGPAPSIDFPRRLPNPAAPVGGQTPGANPKALQQTTLAQSTAAPKAKSPILRQWSEKIGRDEKFEWVTGQLEIENGSYVVYYASPETIDKYHGRIVLVPQTVDMKTFRKGDLVSLRGQLSQRQTLQGATAHYRLTDATLIERPKQ